VLQLVEGAGHLAAGRLQLDLQVAGPGQAHGVDGQDPVLVADAQRRPGQLQDLQGGLAVGADDPS
jgi:hypothetical protein